MLYAIENIDRLDFDKNIIVDQQKYIVLLCQ